MFYKNHSAGFVILDIFKVNRKPGRTFYPEREFSGLSYRYSGSSVFRHDKKDTVIKSGSITYIPEHTDFEVFSEHEEVIIIHLKSYGKEEKEIVNISSASEERVREIFLEMYERWLSRKPGYENRCTALLYTLFCEIEKNEQIYTTKNAYLLQNGILYLNRHYDSSSLKITDLASQCGMSEVYFRKLFKEEYGVSPCRYILKKRIERATRLLESGYYKIYEVASLSGFDDVKYFSTVYKRETGYTPRESLLRAISDHED